jgi:hypothetical protein
MEYFKITDAQQARLIKNTKYKLLKTRAALWFNKISRNCQLTLKYKKQGAHIVGTIKEKSTKINLYKANEER